MASGYKLLEMEMLERDLQSLCTGHCPMPQVSNFTLHITSGLKYLHGLKLLHLDVKPPNILVAGGVAKLGDFGLTASIFPRRKTSQCGGTMCYLAFDTWAGKVYAGYRNDIWGAGCTVSLACN